MAKTLEEINDEIKQLSPEDRHQLLDQLLSEKKSVEKSWIEEADKRWEEIETGKVKTVPGHVVRAEARALINE